MKPQRKVSLRKCIASLQMFPKKSLIRVVRTPENEVMIDPTGKKSGRGAYLHVSLEHIQLAQKKRALEHALKTQVPALIYEELRKYAQQVNRDG